MKKDRFLKLKKRGIPFKTTVLSMFFLVTLTLILVLGLQLLYFAKKLSLESVDLKLNSLAFDIQNKIDSNNKINHNIVETLNILDEKDEKKIFNIYINILKNNNSLYAVFTGYKDGSFYEIINLNSHNSLHEVYGAKPTDSWLLIKISNSNLSKREVFLFDDNLEMTSSKITENDYNPTLRPWYKSAILSNEIIKTMPYAFSHINSNGITYAKQIDKSGNVVAIDVLIDDFKSIYKEHIKNDYIDIYIFNNNGEIISSLKEENQFFRSFFEYKKKNLEELVRPTIITFLNKKYIVQVIPIKNGDNSEYISIFADYDSILAPYELQVFNLLIIFTLTALIMVPIIIYFSGIIIKPIYELVKESLKIKRRRYESIKKVESSILEVSYLSSAFEDMSESIYKYQNSLEEQVKERTKELIDKNQELLKLSITDKLTEIYNRAKLDKTLQEEFNRSKRYKTEFSVILIDIDFFKKVNDTFGHQIGDDVLKESAQVLKNSIRLTDVLGRWGGEEFLIISPQTNLEGAVKIAEHINNAIKLYKFKTYPNKVTMSIGVASYFEDMSKIEEIVLNADKSLYKAKENGRDRVVYHEI
ncbi:diguanylate cyclase [Arcobacter aquimarinus]|uniref:diguanylate cyclase n=1 Tax=Arcobacter aquimarinus TaxID=1315211 RepID=A0AAE7B4P3_9BACT|nr:diguanylate cyclase [Arcobacter aquimarinus]QKE25699.1 diguanylate cyclase [Arcobacter aquimarinus]RXI36157.1 GGDEF domain-containing protein [Arcobacter aquimarinus]